MTKRAIVVLEDISHQWSYRGSQRVVLRDISLSLNSSEILAVVGPSGCGKTTLMRIVAGLLRPSSGNVRYTETLTNNPKIGFMFQDYRLVPWLTVSENIRFGRDSDLARGETLDGLIGLLGLGDHLRDYPGKLSGGLKERTALARALAGDAEVLLLDEPLGSTDYNHRLRIEDEMFKRIVSEELAAVLVTHDLDQAIAMAHRVLILPSPQSTQRAQFFQVPEGVRQYLPSNARLSSELGPVVSQLILAYEALL